MNRSAVTPTKVHEKKIKKSFKKLLTNQLPYGILYIENILNEASFKITYYLVIFSITGVLSCPKSPCVTYIARNLN